MLMPDWLREYRSRQKAGLEAPQLSSGRSPRKIDPLLSDQGFNNHALNDGRHVSPYDTGVVQVGLDGLEVRLLQGMNEDSFKRVLARATRATTGLAVPRGQRMSADWEEEDWEEMMKGGLQSALESQVVIFEVWGASRALTHQLVRTRKAAYHQQSQRATWYGDQPECRMPESIWRAPKDVRLQWLVAVDHCWAAYRRACDAGVSYQDARYILPEGTVNYIQCEYPLREFINTFAYRGCSMFLWEMVACMRLMREALLEQSPWLEPYVKISCEKGALCPDCKGSGKVWPDGVAFDPSDAVTEFPDGTSWYPEPCLRCTGLGGDRKCTFQGWENVEGVCSFPWARQSNRTFLPDPKYRIGASS